MRCAGFSKKKNDDALWCVHAHTARRRQLRAWRSRRTAWPPAPELRLNLVARVGPDGQRDLPLCQEKLGKSLTAACRTTRTLTTRLSTPNFTQQQRIAMLQSLAPVCRHAETVESLGIGYRVPLGPPAYRMATRSRFPMPRTPPHRDYATFQAAAVRACYASLTIRETLGCGC